MFNRNKYNTFDVNNYSDWDAAFWEILMYLWYPRDTLIKEYSFKTPDNKILRADYVISINEPLAIVEIKVWKINVSEQTKNIIRMIQSYDWDIEWYLVVFDNLPDWVKYYKLNKYEQKLEPLSNFPTYEYFRLLKTKKIIGDLNKSNDWFIWISSILWVITIFYYITIVHLCSIDIKTNQLIILWIWIILILLPFFTRIKIAWIEIERIQKSKQEDKINNISK